MIRARRAGSKYGGLGLPPSPEVTQSWRQWGLRWLLKQSPPAPCLKRKEKEPPSTAREERHALVRRTRDQRIRGLGSRGVGLRWGLHRLTSSFQFKGLHNSEELSSIRDREQGSSCRGLPVGYQQGTRGPERGRTRRSQGYQPGSRTGVGTRWSGVLRPGLDPGDLCLALPPVVVTPKTDFLHRRALKALLRAHFSPSRLFDRVIPQTRSTFQGG